MIYTPEDIKNALGTVYDESNEYILARAVDVLFKARDGWTPCGELPDFTESETGTMRILSKPRTPLAPTGGGS